MILKSQSINRILRTFSICSYEAVFPGAGNWMHIDCHRVLEKVPRIVGDLLGGQECKLER